MLVNFIFDETGVFPITGEMRDELVKEGLFNA